MSGDCHRTVLQVIVQFLKSVIELQLFICHVEVERISLQDVCTNLPDMKLQLVLRVAARPAFERKGFLINRLFNFWNKNAQIIFLSLLYFPNSLMDNQATSQSQILQNLRVRIRLFRSFKFFVFRGCSSSFFTIVYLWVCLSFKFIFFNHKYYNVNCYKWISIACWQRKNIKTPIYQFRFKLKKQFVLWLSSFPLQQ